MRQEPLNLPDDGKYSASDVIRMLEISRGKFYADIKRGHIKGKPRRDY